MKSKETMKTIKLKRIYPPDLNSTLTYEKVIEGVVGEMVPFASILNAAIDKLAGVWDNWGKPFTKKTEDHLELGFDFITVIESGVKTIFPIADIKNLAIHFYKLGVVETKDQLAPSQISRIQFTFEDESFIFHYEAKKRKVMDLCQLWYEARVKFKEYSNGRRVFMGKQPKYNEVQKLKEDYDLEW